MAITVETDITPLDIADAMDADPAELYAMLSALLARHRGADGTVDMEERGGFLGGFQPPLEHLRLSKNLENAQAVLDLLNEMVVVLAAAIVNGEEERRRHAS